ncbi:MAG TPA: hypothetical protein VJ746_16380 [Nitrospira sp.]|nr:hypothetical protein [Nitrospira sp.]
MDEAFPDQVWVIVEVTDERYRFTVSEQDPSAPHRSGPSGRPTRLDIICGSEETLFDALNSLGFLPPPASYFHLTAEERTQGKTTVVRPIPPRATS